MCAECSTICSFAGGAVAAGSSVIIRDSLFTENSVQECSFDIASDSLIGQIGGGAVLLSGMQVCVFLPFLLVGESFIFLSFCARVCCHPCIFQHAFVVLFVIQIHDMARCVSGFLVVGPCIIQYYKVDPFGSIMRMCLRCIIQGNDMDPCIILLFSLCIMMWTPIQYRSL